MFDWINNNLSVINDGEENVIDWDNGLFTPLDVFISFFGDVIETAIDEGNDVKRAIVDNDNGRGYVNLILN